MRTANSLGYVDELYDNLPCPGGAYDVTTGAAVTVTVGATTGGIDFVLAQDPAGLLQFGAAAYVAGEKVGTLTVTVTRAGSSAGAVSVTVATANGTATAGSDYTAVSQVVSFARGDAADKTVTIPILDDAVVEGSETFTVTLSAPPGGSAIGLPHLARVTITDDEQSNVIEAMKLKRMGVKRGVHDYFLATPKRIGDKWFAGLWIEMKAPKKKLKPEQQSWLDDD